MSTKYKIIFLVAPFVFLLDQLTKYFVRTYLSLGDRLEVVAGYFDIVHVTNTGAAFGMLSGLPSTIRNPFFYGISFVAVVIIVATLMRLTSSDRLLAFIFSLILGGIAGNIMDRLRLGAVTDFLSVHIGDRVADFEILGRPFHFALEWPAFNVADSAITVSMVLLIYTLLRTPRHLSKES